MKNKYIQMLNESLIDMSSMTKYEGPASKVINHRDAKAPVKTKEQVSNVVSVLERMYREEDSDVLYEGDETNQPVGDDGKDQKIVADAKTEDLSKIATASDPVLPNGEQPKEFSDNIVDADDSTSEDISAKAVVESILEAAEGDEMGEEAGKDKEVSAKDIIESLKEDESVMEEGWFGGANSVAGKMKEKSSYLNQVMGEGEGDEEVKPEDDEDKKLDEMIESILEAEGDEEVKDDESTEDKEIEEMIESILEAEGDEEVKDDESTEDKEIEEAILEADSSETDTGEPKSDKEEEKKSEEEKIESMIEAILEAEGDEEEEKKIEKEIEDEEKKDDDEEKIVESILEGLDDKKEEEEIDDDQKKVESIIETMLESEGEEEKKIEKEIKDKEENVDLNSEPEKKEDEKKKEADVVDVDKGVTEAVNDGEVKNMVEPEDKKEEDKNVIDTRSSKEESLVAEMIQEMNEMDLDENRLAEELQEMFDGE